MHLRIKMHPIDHLIDAHQQQIIRIPFQHRQIIPGGQFYKTCGVLLLLLGVLAAQSGNVVVAIDFTQRAIAADPSIAAFHSNLAKFLADASRCSEALSSADEAIRLEPNFPMAHVNRGYALNRLGRLEQAEESYRRALAHDSKLPEAH